MGQKINPIGLRLGITRTWDSRWFARKGEFAKFLHEDVAIRNFIDKKQFYREGIGRVEIERKSNTKVKVTIHTARPGVIIGRGGERVDQLKKDLEKMTGKSVFLSIQEIKRPDIDAKIIAENVALQLEKRISHRRAMRQSMGRAMCAGAQGIKIHCSGRLGGAEISRSEWQREGRVPLHTLRAEIDFAKSTAVTTFGCIGVKVWVFKGEHIGRNAMPEQTSSREAAYNSSNS